MHVVDIERDCLPIQVLLLYCSNIFVTMSLCTIYMCKKQTEKKGFFIFIFTRWLQTIECIFYCVHFKIDWAVFRWCCFCCWLRIAIYVACLYGAYIRRRFAVLNMLYGNLMEFGFYIYARSKFFYGLAPFLFSIIYSPCFDKGYHSYSFWSKCRRTTFLSNYKITPSYS